MYDSNFKTIYVMSFYAIIACYIKKWFKGTILTHQHLIADTRIFHFF